MNENKWKKFEKSGKVSDYLNYKLSNPNELGALINAGEIKPALPCDVGRKTYGDEYSKLHLPIDAKIGNADQDKSHRP